MSAFHPAIVHVLDGLTYKPGAKFDAWAVPGGTAVGVSREVPDATGRRDKVLLMQTTVLDHSLIEHLGDNAGQYIADRITHLIHEMELHEADEWLKWNGNNCTIPTPTMPKWRADALDH